MNVLRVLVWTRKVELLGSDNVGWSGLCVSRLSDRLCDHLKCQHSHKSLNCVYVHSDFMIRESGFNQQSRKIVHLVNR